jgi:membrane protein YdbS with pleckstrin-like domain
MSDSELVASMKARINPEKVHEKIKMTSYEKAIYFCRPTVLSMSGKYILAFVVLNIHLLFWWANAIEHDTSESSGYVDILIQLTDLLGMFGFVFIMLTITWMNRFLNGSTSGRWYTFSLLMVSLTPILFVIDSIIVWIDVSIAKISGRDEGINGILPSWDDGWYLILGIGYFAILMLLTSIYRRSFSYAISDRTVYLKKDFLLWHTEHNIPLLDIDNLKVNRNPIGRILGYGTINMLTGSGYGIKQESASISTGAAGEAASAVTEDMGILRRFVRVLIVVISLQRTRSTMNDDEPEDCLFGVRRPMRVYRLVNELKEGIRVRSTHSNDGLEESEADTEDELAAASEQPEEAGDNDEDEDDLDDILAELDD